MLRFIQHPVIESTVYVIIGAVLAVLIYISLGYGLGTPTPMVTVVSNSMVPTLERGDLILLEGVNFDKLQTGRENGTIIVYHYPQGNRLIIHRVWKINEDGTLKTWGDNNPSPDPWNVEKSWITGKVLFRVPFLGYPKLLLGGIIGG